MPTMKFLNLYNIHRHYFTFREPVQVVFRFLVWEKPSNKCHVCNLPQPGSAHKLRLFEIIVFAP